MTEGVKCKKKNGNGAEEQGLKRLGRKRQNPQNLQS